MTLEEPDPLSLYRIRMVSEDDMRRLLDPKDDLLQVVECLKRIYLCFVHVVDASRLLAAESESEGEADELRALIAYEMEHAGGWLELLEERLPPLLLEFAGAAFRRPARFHGIGAPSNVVVATKFARATLGNVALIARGDSPRPFAKLGAVSPPTLHRVQLLTCVPALASWILRDLAAAAPWSELFRAIDLECANALRVRSGSTLIQPQHRNIVDSDGLLKKTPARLLKAIKALNDRRVPDIAHKTIAKEADLEPGTPRYFLKNMRIRGLVAKHDEFGWIVTSDGFDQLARYEARTTLP